MESIKKRPIAAKIAVALFAVLFIFQALLVAGVPLGSAAWGGTTETLPVALRVASAVVMAFVLLGVWTVLARSGHITVGPRGYGIARRLIWAYAVLFGLSTLLNLASSSPWERFGGAPFGAALTICCFILHFYKHIRL